MTKLPLSLHIAERNENRNFLKVLLFIPQLINLRLSGVVNMVLWLGQQTQVRYRAYTVNSNADVLAHDIAEDMVVAGMASVTMIQRSKTCTLYYIPWRQ